MDDSHPYDVVITGAGLAAATAAHELQEAGLRVLVLAGDSRIGGHANRELTRYGIPYPTGSTVLGVGALQHGRGYQFLRDIGVPLRRRYELECDVVHLDGQFVSPNPEKRGQTSLDRQLAREVGYATQVLEHIFQRRAGEAPFMPLQQAPQRLLDFDRLSFATFLEGLGPLARRLFTKNIASDAAERPEFLSSLSGMWDQAMDQETRIAPGNTPSKRYLLPGGNMDVVERAFAATRRKADKPPVAVLLNTRVTHIDSSRKAPFREVTYTDGEHHTHVARGRFVLLGLPAHRIPPILPSLSASVKSLLDVKHGAYALVHLFMNRSPLIPNTFYMLPDNHYVADIVQTPAMQPTLRPDGRIQHEPHKPSIWSLYLPFTPDMVPTVPTDPEAIGTLALNEMRAIFPDAESLMTAAPRVTYFPESMSSPLPGQLQQLHELGLELAPNVFAIHSDFSGVFSAPGAIATALHGVELVKNAVFRPAADRWQAAA
jgi:phytoene dehydrogenase-like protein